MPPRAIGDATGSGRAMLVQTLHNSSPDHYALMRHGINGQLERLAQKLPSCVIELRRAKRPNGHLQKRLFGKLTRRSLPHQ